MKKVLAYTLGVNHPSGRLRVAAYADHFRKQGWQLDVHAFDPGMGKAVPKSASLLSSVVRRLNRRRKTTLAVVALRRLQPQDPIIISRELPVSIRPFLETPNPILLDVDDALYLDPSRERLFTLCRRAEVVICGNQIIADHLSPHARRCVVIPTVVDPELYEVPAGYKSHKVLRLGWLGSSMSFDQTLLPWLPVLESIRSQTPFELILILDECPAAVREKNWIRFVRWSSEVETTLARHIDVGIMPLQDNPYQTAKCGAKLVQYLAAGLPVIATPLGVNRELVQDGGTGSWAVSAEEWKRAIAILTEPSVRERFGQAGRAHVMKDYSLATWSTKWIALLEELSR